MFLAPHVGTWHVLKIVSCCSASRQHSCRAKRLSGPPRFHRPGGQDYSLPYVAAHKPRGPASTHIAPMLLLPLRVVYPSTQFRVPISCWNPKRSLPSCLGFATRSHTPSCLCFLLPSSGSMANDVSVAHVSLSLFASVSVSVSICLSLFFLFFLFFLPPPLVICRFGLPVKEDRIVRLKRTGSECRHGR